jgi:hypothetical protein
MRDPAPRLVWLQTVRSLIILPIGKKCQVDQEQTPQERARELVSWLVPNWRPTERQVLWAIRIAIVLGVLIAVGSTYGITLWDWAQLLIIPAVIAGGGIWFNQRQQERELHLADQRAQDEALQAYLGQMSSLLLEKDLRASEEGSEVRTLARARTLTVLGRLDPNRQADVIEFFLIEAELVQRVEGTGPIIRLSGANLSKANLSGGSLVKVDLRGADLSDAHLNYATLVEANLSGVNLSRADLSGADLERANLRGARSITNEDLKRQTFRLEGATMPNGQKYEDRLKSKGSGEDGEDSGPS